MLRDRIVTDERLITAIPGSTSFQSPGFNEGKYKNSMFCLYNITLTNCNSITVRSTSEDYSLFVDENDYLYLDFGVENSPVTLYGSEVGSYYDSFYSSSLYAVFWSNADRHTSAGAFELEAICSEDNAMVEGYQSGGIDLGC